MNLPAKVGILAGEGDYPTLLSRAILNQQGVVVVAGLVGQARASDFEQTGVKFAPVYLGAFKSVARFFHHHDTAHIYFAGGVRRKNAWMYLRPDRIGIALLKNALLSGDDSLLKKSAKVFSQLGVHVGDPAPFIQSLLAPRGLIAGPEPISDTILAMKIGWQHAKSLGAEDRGQGVVIHNNRLLSCEDRAGTDALIKRALPGSVLVKVVKPGQDRRFDLPAIGPNTISQCRQSGVRAIGVEAGGVLLLHRHRIITECQTAKISLVGL